MARVKQAVPVQRAPSSEYVSKNDREAALAAKQRDAAAAEAVLAAGSSKDGASSAGVKQAVIAVAGIYGSFLTWGYLQEKLTTTAYPVVDAAAGQQQQQQEEVFAFPVFLNTVQSALAAVAGLLYLRAATPRGRPVPPIVPAARLLGPLLLVALTSSLASPFGYAALNLGGGAGIDYITYLLAKSCKLLPVMLLHVTLFRRRYPLYKYLVVAAVTAGVAVFTLHGQAAKKGKRSASSASSSSSSSSGSSPSSALGLLFLAINLLFDGLTNTTQDYIFEAFRPYSGPQMMCANSLMQTAVTATYLLVISPLLARSPGLGGWLGVAQATTSSSSSSGGGELAAALAFLQRHPAVWRDVLGFSACGAIGQIFIFYALSTFSSVFLVTVTVTRKMCTMILSVLAFGHRLSHMQWLGVGLVFGGIAAEAQMTRAEKLRKEAAKKGKAA